MSFLLLTPFFLKSFLSDTQYPKLKLNILCNKLR